MKTKKLWRHGDVIIERVNDECAMGKKIEFRHDVVLAEGEATGHAHRINSSFGACCYSDPSNDNAKLLVLIRPSDLMHEEHSKIQLPPGTYRVRIKRQYSPEGWEKVID